MLYSINPVHYTPQKYLFIHQDVSTLNLLHEQKHLT